MGKIILKTGLKRENGYVYFITKAGDLAKVKTARHGKRKDKKRQIIAKLGIKKEKGRLYYVDRSMNIGKTSLVLGREGKKRHGKKKN